MKKFRFFSILFAQLSFSSLHAPLHHKLLKALQFQVFLRFQQVKMR